MWRRLVTTNVRDPKDAIRELKRHVHRLYKHIHPDRLGRFPEHRAVNEASFQVLQAALERHFDRVEARMKYIPSQAHQGPQQLTFFTQIGRASAETASADGEALRKAVVRFHESNLGHVLHSLFESLGLEPPPRNILPGQSRGPFGHKHQFASLTDLVKHARQVIMTNIKRQHAGASDSVQPGLDNEMLVTRLALQRSRGVHITLGGGLPAKDKLVLIFRRLARTMAEARDVELGNLVVEIDGGFDVSLNTEGAYPWIVLGACASGQSWLQSLLSEEVTAACETSKRRMTRLSKMESLAATVLGVKLVMHHIGLLGVNGDGKDDEPSSSPSSKGAQLHGLLRGSSALRKYEELLQSIIHTVEQNGATAKMNVLESVVLMIDEGSGTKTEAEQGVIRVGLNEGADAVLQALQKDGAVVNQTFEIAQARKEGEQKLVANVKRAVGIGGLRRGEGISDRDWTEALGRMRADAGRLRGVLDGVPVVVGTRARILEDSGEIEVPFDFYRSIRI